MSGEARPKPLLSIRETAELLSWKPTRTYEAARRGELPGLVTINGRYHVKRLVLLAWLAGEDQAMPTPPADMMSARRRQAGGRSA